MPAGSEKNQPTFHLNGSSRHLWLDYFHVLRMLFFFFFSCNFPPDTSLCNILFICRFYYLGFFTSSEL